MKIYIPGKSKCILGKLRIGANLAKMSREPKPYECSKKLMKELGRHNLENNNIFLNRHRLMIKNYNKFNKIINQHRF